MTSSQLSDQSMYSRGQVLTRDFNTLRSLIVLKYLGGERRVKARAGRPELAGPGGARDRD